MDPGLSPASGKGERSPGGISRFTWGGLELSGVSSSTTRPRDDRSERGGRISSLFGVLPFVESYGCTCKKPALHSGEYGIFHPGPYYIPNPTLAIEYPAACEPCRSRSMSAKISPDPNNRIEMTIGVWE